jgi:transglutaminase-like putative cysteine protease
MMIQPGSPQALSNQHVIAPHGNRSGLGSREVGVAISVMLYLLCTAGVGSRIFTNESYLGPSLAVILIGQVLFVIAVAVRAPLWVGAALSAVGSGVTLTHLHAAGSHWFGLPTGATWDIFGEQLFEAQTLFATATAPVSYDSSWALPFSIGIAFVAIATLILAQVRRAHFLALLPGTTLFIFLSVLGSGPGGLRLTLLVIISGYLMAATLRGSSHVSVVRLMSTGATIALVGIIAVPYLPGADQDPWVTTRGRFGTIDNRLSPLVDIQGRLVSQSTVEMFRVESSEPAYWRMLTLTEFDGRRFTAPSSPLNISGLSEPDLAVRNRNPRVVEQQVRIAALGGNLLPVAAVPIAVSPDPESESESPLDIRWDSDISAAVRTDRDLLPEDRFLLQSAISNFQVADLLQRTALQPPNPIHLSLPEDFPQSVINLAASIIETGLAGSNVPDTAQPGSPNTVRGGRQPYLVARILQDWFRSEFDYSLEISPGHGSAALERFLADRIGYCEQFAATFVAMARSQGVPSRVAVGFTPGIQRAPELYSVQGRHAHAWPEVWFDGLGWVPFEPTPGRGLPGSEEHTGLPAQQDGPLGLDESSSEGSSGFDSIDQIPDLNDLINGPDVEIDPEPTSGEETADDQPSFFTTHRPLITLALITLAVTVILGPWIWRQWRTQRMRRLPPHIEVLTMWQGQLLALRRHGMITDKAMTITEILRVAPQRLPGLSEPLTGLGEAALAMGFSADPTISEADLEQCRQWDSQMRKIFSGRRGPLTKFLNYFAVWRDYPRRS